MTQFRRKSEEAWHVTDFVKHYPLTSGSVSTLVIATLGYAFVPGAQTKFKWGKREEQSLEDASSGNSICGFDNDHTDTGLPCSGSGLVEPQFDNANKGWFEDGDAMVAVGAVALLFAAYAADRFLFGRKAGGSAQPA